MSPAFFVLLPFTLLLMMAKGVGNSSGKSTLEKLSSDEVIDLLTDRKSAVSLLAVAEKEALDAHNNRVVVGPNGRHYLVSNFTQM